MPPATRPEPPPALVTVTVWGVAPRRVPAALLRVGTAGAALRGVPGLRFAKLLGTAVGDGDPRSSGFTVRDTDLRHWALVAAWDSVGIADAFADTATARRWAAAADETFEVRLRPLASRGRWSGREPFTPVVGAPPPHADAAVAAITRARVRPSRWRRFSAAVPPVARDLHGRDGVLVAMGVGEAPVGFQGTFSVWRSGDALRQYAYRDRAHAAVIEDTRREGWYAEELFARFEVLSAHGRYRGTTLDLTPGGGPA